MVPGDLELDVLLVMDELLKLFHVAFHKSLPRFIDGFVSRRGRAAANEMLEESLESRSDCPESNFSSGELRHLSGIAPTTL